MHVQRSTKNISILDILIPTMPEPRGLLASCLLVRVVPMLEQTKTICPHEAILGPYLPMDNEDSDQTGLLPTLI